MNYFATASRVESQFSFRLLVISRASVVLVPSFDRGVCQCGLIGLLLAQVPSAAWPFPCAILAFPSTAI